MCLPNFVEVKQIEESNPLIGYRTWRNEIKDNSLTLISEHLDYKWSVTEGPHEIKETDSGIYAYYNNYYNNYYNYYYYNNNYYNYYNYNYNYYYYNYKYYNYNYNYNYLSGIIKQWGTCAIHKIGQRSEFAKVDTIFTIRESDMSGPENFTGWIIKFNLHIKSIANKYNCKTISWQDFKDGEITKSHS